MHAGCPVIKGSRPPARARPPARRLAHAPGAGGLPSRPLAHGPGAGLPSRPLPAFAPPPAGVKWTGTKWFHQKPFRPATFTRPRAHEVQPDPGHCRDDDSRCPQWRQEGQCESNAAYMVRRAARGEAGRGAGRCGLLGAAGGGWALLAAAGRC
jgi:hypothetical protein